MAFTLTATVGTTTVDLNDGNPFLLEGAEELSAAPIIRHEQHGPLQHGATDLGFRFAPRILTLNLLFYATTDAALDGHRDTLVALFKPLDTESITLTVTRDDGAVRTLSCYTVDEIDMVMVPEERAAHLHRATVKLRAAYPLWQANSTTAGTVEYSAMSSWWLAGGAIGTANVMDTREYPAQAPVLPFPGTITGDWSVVVVTAKGTPAAGTENFVWQDGTGGSASFHSNTDASHFSITDSGLGGAGAGNDITWPGTTGYNYHVVESRSGTQYWRYWNNGVLTVHANTTDAGTVTYDHSLRGGAAFSYRANRTDSSHDWEPEIRKAAIYGTVTTTQLQTLGPYLLDNLQGSVVIANNGQVNAYPLITLRGPIADPVIVNQTGGGTINLTGGTIPQGHTWTIDLRDGYKRMINQAGANVMGSVPTAPMDLAFFRITQGTSTIVMTPGSVGSDALFAIEFTEEYWSW